VGGHVVALKDQYLWTWVRNLVSSAVVVVEVGEIVEEVLAEMLVGDAMMKKQLFAGTVASKAILSERAPTFRINL
jgi:hypothetical protein